MARALRLRIGVSDDPHALQPTLPDCIDAVLTLGEDMMAEVLKGLEAAVLLPGPRRVAALQRQPIRGTVEAMLARAPELCRRFSDELGHHVYHSGGKDETGAESLRFEDLQLLADAELDVSIEVARAQQEVQLAVDDALPQLDAVVSTLLGWRTIQPGLNPLRPEVFVRALRNTLAAYVIDPAVRESLITPAAGVMGVQLNKVYRELNEWLRSAGIEPAMPIGGRVRVGQPGTSMVSETMAKTMLTLDRLRKLLAGDFDPGRGKGEFLHTVPASYVALQELKQVDSLVQRLEQRRSGADAQAQDEAPDAAQPGATAGAPRMGHRLGVEVVRLMFDNLAEDKRLLPGYKRLLREIEPAVRRLARQDSRFFSDRSHPARVLLDAMTQRSLAYPSETHEGWSRFAATVRDAVAWLNSKVIDSETFGELLDQLRAEWDRQDEAIRQRNAEAARALLHAEQRNLLAQKLATDFEALMHGLDVPDFVRDFLKVSWAQVVAEARLTGPADTDDPWGYRALVDDLIWSVQRTAAQRGRLRRLAQMVPGLISRLREGLLRINYPNELTSHFFDNLVAVHEAALQEGRDAAASAAAQAAADAAEAEPSQFGDSMLDMADPWVAEPEAEGAGFVDAQSLQPLPQDAQAEAPVSLAAGDLRTGAWVELLVKGQWLRVQLTWASPHATLFMFTSPAGTAHSMSRRTLERLRAQGSIRVVAERHVVDEALDRVAKVALHNTLQKRPSAG